MNSPLLNLANTPHSGPAPGDRAIETTGRPMWLELSPDPVFAVLHRPGSAAATGAAALILPAFGWDDEFSYRPRREWATRLAQAGVTTLRIDFPGSENSAGSPLAPGRFPSWIAATVAAAGWLRRESGCRRLTVVGIGLGGQVAHQAVLAGAAVDDLILWGVRASGRAYLRELRAHAAVAMDPGDSERDALRPNVAAGLGGHVLSAESAEAIGALDLAGGKPLPQVQRRRVLLIGRDAHGVDRKLREGFEASGATVTVQEADDYESLVGLPELLRYPEGTIRASIDWILALEADRPPPLEHAPATAIPASSDSIELSHGGTRIRERIVNFDTSQGRLVGIISEPVDAAPAAYCLTVLNSGSLRHTGPYRIFVDLARNAAAAGVPAFRFDLPGLGDSDGRSTKIFERSAEDHDQLLAVASEVYDELARLGVADRFALTGLCLGGYLAVRTTRLDPRVMAAISINPPALDWTEVQRLTLIRGITAETGPETTAAVRNRRVPDRLRRLMDRAVQSRYQVDSEARRRLAQVGPLWRFVHRHDLSEFTDLLEGYSATGARILFIFSEQEMLNRAFTQPELASRLARWPGITIERLPTNDHNLGPHWSRNMLFDLVSRELRELTTLSQPTRGGD